MPLKDDFIARTIEQLAEAVAAILGVRQAASSHEDLERLIAAAYREHTGSEASLLRRLSSAELLAVLSSAGVLDRDKAYLLAALNEAEAELAAIRGEGDGADYRVKALELYLEAALSGLNLPELNERIAWISAELDAYLLPETTEWRLFHYALAQARYAEAEDRLFALLGRWGPTPAVREAGESFYRGLERLNDAELTAGGLPRNEVSEGLAAFEAGLVEG